MPLPQGMHNTAQAVRTAAELVQWAWVQLAEGSSLSAGEQRAYIGGLTTPRSIEHPVGGDPYQARVVNLATAAPRLEHGFAAYHLPERINWAQALSDSSVSVNEACAPTIPRNNPAPVPELSVLMDSRKALDSCRPSSRSWGPPRSVTS